MNWYKRSQSGVFINLYRGMEQELSSDFDLSMSDAPIGYSTWTDNIELAREYAGFSGFIYKIILPIDEMGESFINEDGERALFFNNDKNAGLNGISGNEYLVYHDHDKYDFNLIKRIG